MALLKHSCWSPSPCRRREGHGRRRLWNGEAIRGRHLLRAVPHLSRRRVQVGRRLRSVPIRRGVRQRWARFLPSDHRASCHGPSIRWRSPPRRTCTSYCATPSSSTAAGRALRWRNIVEQSATHCLPGICRSYGVIMSHIGDGFLSLNPGLRKWLSSGTSVGWISVARSTAEHFPHAPTKHISSLN
ncbi:F-box protein PP2-B10-like [Iris pallida]|uniref:F-box protein PP2-B10-like n=1 Tax=Iris pallida TaxID=29817 RepID=A0AAX6HR17_IRIPA|nr:F-box protein PP2-B10-like [Iris pallida]